ncbi:hypothetical protein [Actinoplanes sp. NPDC048796]|uniref:hypothetical protein n=1 Tax=Actinoplanes sp. NPDC048796 TaxID=3155640 RepID=UPI0033F33235
MSGMDELRRFGATGAEALEAANRIADLLREAVHVQPQYGTSMHWPSCVVADCTGCLPPLAGEQRL